MICGIYNCSIHGGPMFTNKHSVNGGPTLYGKISHVQWMNPLFQWQCFIVNIYQRVMIVIMIPIVDDVIDFTVT